MESTVVFARYALERWGGQENTEILRNFVSTHAKSEDQHRRFFYVIVDPQTHRHDGEEIVLAKLAKIRIARQADFWDERRWRTIPARLPSPQAESQVKFVAFGDNMIAFEIRRPYITKATFLRVMPILYSIAADQALRVLHLELIKDERQVTEWLREYERVVKVKFERLRKPNPVDEPILDKIKRQIDETRAKNMTFENKDEGVNTEPGSLIDSGIHLAQEGYGDFDIEAQSGQTTARRTSREFTYMKRIQYEDDREFVEKTWTEKRTLRRRRRSREDQR